MFVCVCVCVCTWCVCVCVCVCVLCVYARCGECVFVCVFGELLLLFWGMIPSASWKRLLCFGQKVREGKYMHQLCPLCNIA